MRAQLYDSPLRWLVSSDRRPGVEYLVDLGEPECACEDFQFRGLRCKHFYPAEQALLELVISTLKTPCPKTDSPGSC